MLFSHQAQKQKGSFISYQERDHKYYIIGILVPSACYLLAAAEDQRMAQHNMIIWRSAVLFGSRTTRYI